MSMSSSVTNIKYNTEQKANITSCMWLTGNGFELQIKIARPSYLILYMWPYHNNNNYNYITCITLLKGGYNSDLTSKPEAE